MSSTRGQGDADKPHVRCFEIAGERCQRAEGDRRASARASERRASVVASESSEGGTNNGAQREWAGIATSDLRSGGAGPVNRRRRHVFLGEDLPSTAVAAAIGFTGQTTLGPRTPSHRVATCTLVVIQGCFVSTAISPPLRAARFTSPSFIQGADHLRQGAMAVFSRVDTILLCVWC